MSVRLRMKRGDEFSFEASVTKGNAPFDLKGSTVHFFAKDSRNDSDPSLIKLSTVLGGVSILDSPNGKVRVTLLPADTLPLPNQTKHYEFDLKVKEQDGSVFSVLCGELIVRASVNEAGLG